MWLPILTLTLVSAVTITSAYNLEAKFEDLGIPNSDYFFAPPDFKVPQLQGEAICQKLGGHLPDIKDGRELATLNNRLNKDGGQQELLLSGAVCRGSYLWDPTSQPIDKNLWCNGEPPPGGDKLCTSLQTNANGGCIKESNCDGDFHRLMCQKPKQKDPRGQEPGHAWTPPLMLPVYFNVDPSSVPDSHYQQPEYQNVQTSPQNPQSQGGGFGGVQVSPPNPQYQGGGDGGFGGVQVSPPNPQYQGGGGGGGFGGVQVSPPNPQYQGGGSGGGYGGGGGGGYGGGNGGYGGGGGGYGGGGGGYGGGSPQVFY